VVTPGPAAVAVGSGSARFSVGDVEVGRYVLDDRHKPYLHPLRTIGGRVVTLAIPFDHPHHKGVMYALTTTDVNWWEETGSADYVPTIGVQVQEELATPAPGSIRQRLRWTAEDGALPTFAEERTISCAWCEDGFLRWTWSARLDVLRDVTLRHSPYAIPAADGTPTNYHGLGIRFPRTFGWSVKAGTDSADGIVRAGAEIMGTRPTCTAISDLVDGEFPPARVSVRVIQPASKHAVFLMRTPFSYFSIGPSVAEPVELKRGDHIDEQYLIDIADGTFG
jgi:hypothetical protein